MNQNENNLNNLNNISTNNESSTPNLPNNQPFDTNISSKPVIEESSLEANIIDIPIPADALKELETVVEPIKDVTPIPEVIAVDSSKDNTEPSAMVETELDDGTTNNSKGALPVFIIFGIFIVLLIGFPYLSDYVEKLKSERKAEEFEEYKNTLAPSPTTTPTADTKNNFDELYDSCGTEEIFTNISINYELKENQCFKINLNNTKTFIKYIPAVTEEDTTWSIYLGEKEVYSTELLSSNTISSISILENNTVEMKEVDILGNLINTYNFDVNGNLITPSNPNQ